MGNCFGSSSNDSDNAAVPTNHEQRRAAAARAAEQRLAQSESRGLKDAEGYKKKLQKREQMEREADQSSGGAGLKWQVG